MNIIRMDVLTKMLEDQQEFLVFTSCNGQQLKLKCSARNSWFYGYIRTEYTPCFLR